MDLNETQGYFSTNSTTGNNYIRLRHWQFTRRYRVRLLCYVFIVVIAQADFTITWLPSCNNWAYSILPAMPSD